MYKINKLASAVALAILFPGSALAELEVSGAAKIEAGLYTAEGKTLPQNKTHDSMDPMKTETTLKLFLNSDIGEESSFHAELLLANDGESVSSRHDGGEAYTQYEFLRELYFDVPAAGWDFRLGKQQVVWGTADGIKLLDMINPTDYRELNQNAAEDSRIPVWMINAEKYFDSGANIQVIVSESKPNFISGLDAGGDSNAPFLFKGVDTITGSENGFLNIGKDMGKTSGVFQTLLTMGGLTGTNPSDGSRTNALTTGPMAFTTVSQFVALDTNPTPTWPNKNFSQVGLGLVATPNIDLNSDGTPDVVRNVNLSDGSTDATNAAAGTAFQLPGPLAQDATDPRVDLLNAVFLPFMSQLKTGNQVLYMASNKAGDLLTNFSGYLGQLETAYGAGNGFDLDQDGTDDLTNAEIGDALNDLGSQMYQSVAMGMGLSTDPAVSAASVATNLGVNPPTANPADADTIAFNTAVKNAAIQGMGQTYFNNSSTNQFTGVLNTSNPTSAFDYMGNATFGTFDSFIGMKTEYRNKHEDEANQNIGFRFKNTTEGGTNYSLNYAMRYDPNPYIDMHWEDSQGNKLTVAKNQQSMDALGQPIMDFNGDGTIDNPNSEAYKVTTVSLMKNATTRFNSQTDGPATLVMEEKLNDISTVGGSFDTAVDGLAVPMIIRGELAYDIGVMQPVIDKDELSIGNLTGALKMEETDMLKYVLGVDITVLSNLLVSTQLIQFHNLDFIDTNNGMKYTGDFSSMHLTNGLNKGDEVETFISFYLSKPFGAEGQHRWNNILIQENGGGYWNRFDIEYGFSDEMVGTIEYNKYWGDENTMFGQFEKSSNIQLGFKYLF